MDKQRISYLLSGYSSGQLTTLEKQELMSLLDNSQQSEGFEEIIALLINETPAIEVADKQKWEPLLKKVFAADKTGVRSSSYRASVHRIHFLKTTWFRYAAAIILLLGIGGYLLWSDRGEIPAFSGNDKGKIVRTQPPNNNKPILTLASGKKIELNDTKTPLLVKEGAIFDPREAGQKSGMASYNTITTPKGIQYQVILPDGTKAWLNAASSIKFPATFGETRKIEATGEIYLEVAVNKTAPFIVNSRGMEVQVLGTSFNINAYNNESAIKTTLISGSVKVARLGQAAILTPGQQAIVTEESPEGGIKLRKADITQVLAWKDGLFNFNGASLKEVMNQLERWYDIEVVYEKGVPDIYFEGEMSRNVTLAGLLRGLEGFMIHYKLEGKKLTIMP